MRSVLGIFVCAIWMSTSLAHGAQGPGNLLSNGDFETNTAVACQSNIANPNLSSYLPTAVGFGASSEIDLYRTACYGVAAISGTTKVGIHCSSPGVSDEFSLALSTPVFAGEQLNLAFAAQAVLDFDPGIGTVEIGLSNAANSFGTPVYSGSLTAAYVWEWFGSNINVTANSSFLTIRVSTGTSWVHVDAFSLTLGASGLFCSGDGSGLACPCASGTAASRGCANSAFAEGARLYRTGNAGSSAATDTLSLVASELAGPGLFVQGTSNGTGFPFGDGLFCLTGTLTRLGVAFPAGGMGALPNAGAPTPLHVAGGVAVGDVRSYQVWYRDALPYCTPSTFNLTEGIVITWGA